MVAGMILPRFEYEAPRSISEAAALVGAGSKDARIMAGGTDILVRMKRGLLDARLIVSLRRVEGLSGVESIDGGGVRIGALETMARLARQPLLSGPFAGVAEGAGSVGGPIVRNRATVGGNIVNARPCADTVPALIALGARLELQGSNGVRTADLDGFINAPGATAILPGELLTAVEIPSPTTRNAGSCYIKITRRLAMDITIVGCAASIELDKDRRRITRARLVFASVAPIPLRIREAEAILEGAEPKAEIVQAAATAARKVAKPIDDLRGPAWYRTEIVEVTARRALNAALERAGWRAKS